MEMLVLVLVLVVMVAVVDSFMETHSWLCSHRSG